MRPCWLWLSCAALLAACPPPPPPPPRAPLLLLTSGPWLAEEPDSVAVSAPGPGQGPTAAMLRRASADRGFIGSLIGGVTWLPLEVNVPDMVRWLYALLGGAGAPAAASPAPAPAAAPALMLRLRPAPWPPSFGEAPPPPRLQLLSSVSS